MTSRFSDHLLEGLAASRPSATTVPEGTLYASTDEGLIYQSDGATWTNWALIIPSPSGAADGDVVTLDTGLPTWNTPAAGGAADGWTATSGLSYSSADAPTFVITTAADLTALIPVGARIKLTQTTVKYFIVTAITASTITVYGGTDYTLANAAITLPYYSLAKAPIGFPLDPAKWTVELADTSQRSQASPVSSTWYNLGSLSISIPIGSWRVYYEVSVGVAKPTATNCEARAALSTANNSASDTSMISYAYQGGASGTQNMWDTFHRERFLTLASKTSYYLNAMQGAGTGTSSISFEGQVSPTIIRAVCAYL